MGQRSVPPLCGDALHASRLGALAAAYTIVAALLEIDPVELPALTGNVPSAQVTAVRRVQSAREPRSLRNYSAGDFEADWSRYHRWTFEWTAQEISQVVSAYAATSVGTLHHPAAR